MATKWVHLMTDIVGDRFAVPAGTDIELEAREADRYIQGGMASELAGPPQRPAVIGPKPAPAAPESAMANPAAEQAVLPAARPRGRPPKNPVLETVPPDDEPAVNE